MKLLTPKALVPLVLCVYLLAGAPVRAQESSRQDEAIPKIRPLTEKEKAILAEGEIGEGRRITGGVVGTLFGFGTGHAVMGKYLEQGWIFTVTEVVVGAALVSSLNKSGEECFFGSDENCASETAKFALSAIAFTALRIWEIVDVWTRPNRHNERVRELREGADRSSWLIQPTLQFSSPGEPLPGLVFSLRF